MKSLASTRRQFLPLFGLVLTALSVFILGACSNGNESPPTEIVIITSDPLANATNLNGIVGEGEIALATANANIGFLQQTIVAQETLITDLQGPSETQVVAETPTILPTISPTPSLSPSPTETILPSIFPTPQVEQVIVVEQIFEHGRMLWFRENQRIWVLVGDNKQIDPTQGAWYCFVDTFQEGEVEALPEFDPTPNTVIQSVYSNEPLRQPIRGFGKIWRENEILRESLGWALTREIEHFTRRDYLAGGRVENDQYFPDAGEWRIQSFFGGTLVFYENMLNMDCITQQEFGTWVLRN